MNLPHLLPPRSDPSRFLPFSPASLRAAGASLLAGALLACAVPTPLSGQSGSGAPPPAAATAPAPAPVATAPVATAPAPGTVRIGDRDFTAAELKEALSERQLRRLERREGSGSERWPDLGVVGFMAVFFGFIAVMALGGFWVEDRKEERRHATLRLFVEKGQPVPPELIGSARFRWKDEWHQYVTGGAVAAVVGGALLVVFLSSGRSGPQLLGGIIPLAIGLVILGYGLFLRKQQRSDPDRRVS